MNDTLWTIAEEPDDFVYVPDLIDGYKLGRIRDLGADMMSVELEDTKQIVKVGFDNVLSADDNPMKSVDDSSSLIHLNEATLFDNCRVRYAAGQIYTYVGSVLIAVNPYESMPALYDEATMRSYVGKSLGAMPPHVFAIADKAYRDMHRTRQSQSVVVTGESGAGKTETQKCILRYLCHCCGPSAAGQLETRLIETNIILDAFGNAKTLRNNNSSRFGKFIQVHFDESHKIVGGFVSHYLLEKTRVCLRLDGERNFHVFHQLVASARFTDEFQLRRFADFQYLRNGCHQMLRHADSIELDYDDAETEVIVDAVVDDVADFQRLLNALLGIGFDVDERQDLLRLLAGILHLGNVDFDDQVDDFRGGTRVAPSSEASLKLAASLIGLNADQLRLGLTARMMQPTRGGMKGTLIMVPLHYRECVAARDALAKALYTRLFDVIVAHINTSIPFDGATDTRFIGILDIAGFEFFEMNSFEQFCINYCNEKLQQFFNDRILKYEQDLYDEEGLNVSRIDYSDNRDCIELFEARKTGLLDLLDEEARLPKASVQHFALAAKQMNAKNPRIESTRKATLKRHRELRDDEGFLVRHYAAPVCYETVSFLEKNNDALHDLLEMLLLESENTLVKKICVQGGVQPSTAFGVGKVAGPARKLNVSSVGCKFRVQLAQLMNKLDQTNTHFIRCLKPNTEMAAGKFSGGEVLGQLKCAGMDNVLKLMQRGFPSRTSFADLYCMYEGQLPARLTQLDPHLFCRCLFHALGLNDADYRFGTTRVFFRAGKFAEFDQVMKQDVESMRQLIDQVESWIQRIRWRRAQTVIICCVRVMRQIEQKKRRIEEEQRRIEEEQRRIEEEQRRIEEEERLAAEQAAQSEERRCREVEECEVNESNHKIVDVEFQEEDEESEVEKRKILDGKEQAIELDGIQLRELVARWTYAKLDKVKNSTSDSRMRAACSAECHRRLAHYRNWRNADRATRH